MRSCVDCVVVLGVRSCVGVVVVVLTCPFMCWRCCCIDVSVHVSVVLFSVQVLVALACDLSLDLALSVSDKQWTWLKQYCLASRVAYSIYNRKPFPTQFVEQVPTYTNYSVCFYGCDGL